MARLPRIVLPGYPLHVVQRGNNRQACFFSEDDYLLYLKCVSDAAVRYGCFVHAYVLMTNHVHLLVTPTTKQSISTALQSVGRSYVRYINMTYRRSGTLWEGRYKSAVVDSERYLLACSRYIELNPVRAGMVDRPDDYRWSSYHCNALGVLDELVTPHTIYNDLGSSDNERQAAYRSMISACADTVDVNAIRHVTGQGAVLGDDRFLAQIEAVLGRRVSKFNHGGDRKSREFREKYQA